MSFIPEDVMQYDSTVFERHHGRRGEALRRGDFDDCAQCGSPVDMHAVWCPLYREDAEDE